ncbi:MAG: hypothetical protein H0V80_10175 [Acidobacteria bacterium]|nr:hypothetical protein [Acidobacteriota bacterium]
MLTRAIIAVATTLTALSPGVAGAQQVLPRSALTASGGYALFVDELLIPHAVVGVGAEWLATPRIAVGPELLYMVGPGSDRDLFVLGVVRVGIRPFSARVAPFVTAGGGLMRHSSRFGGRAFSATEGAYVAGGGVRIAVTPRVSLAPEVTTGWEAHLRASVSVGIRLR